MGYIGPAAAAAAIAAAGTDWDVVTMTAIAGAESGWNTSAISPTNDYGLLQINTYYWGSLFHQYQWDDANQNAQMAHVVWRSGGYGQWSTYNQGDYRRYLAQAQEAAGQAGSAPSGLPGTDASLQQTDWSGWDYSDRVGTTAGGMRQQVVNLYAFGVWLQNRLYR